jgi:hypothetical protein
MTIPSTGGERMDRYRTHMSRYERWLLYQTCADVAVAKDCQICPPSRGCLQGPGEACRKAHHSTHHRNPAQSRLGATTPQNGRKHFSQINASIVSGHQYTEEIRLKVWGKEESDGWRPLQIICKGETKGKGCRQVSRVNPCADR